jgi:hypothetical protein
MSTLVTVACKLPHGLVLELGKIGADTYQKHVIAGPYTTDKAGNPASIVVNGYAFTRVPESFWNAWAQAHKGAAYLRNRAVYAETTDDKAKAASLSDSGTRTGFERLDPDKPMAGIEPDREHLKQQSRIAV